MKILAWMLFVTLTLAFVVVFCKQQIEVHAEAQLVELGRPTPQWTQVAAMDFGDSIEPATTQPSAIVAPTVAAGDLGDALR